MPSHFYHRKLPHFQPVEATFFVTFRLAGSIPKDVIRRLRENHQLLEKGILQQKRLFADVDAFLDSNPNEPYWCRENAVAEIVIEAIHYRDTKQYDLQAYTIMPNHVHMMMTLLPGAPVLFKVMQHLKRISAKSSNKFLSRTGSEFWEDESYDHVVRDENEFYRILNYILRNPVKAGFVKEWQDCPYTFAKPMLL